MICPNCGANNAEGQTVCYNCGNPLPQDAAQGWTPPPPSGTPPPPGPPPGGVPPAPPPTPPAPPPTFQPAAGGQPPVQPPRRTSAGLAGVIAFLAVLAIGLLVFIVFIKGGSSSPQAAPSSPVATATSPPPVTTSAVPTTTTAAATTSAAATTAVPASPPPTKPGGGPKMFVLACSKISGGKCLGSTGLRPPFIRSGSDNRLVILIGLLNVPAGVNISATVLDASTGAPVVPTFTCVTTGASPFECRFHVLPPPGGFGRQTLEVVFHANGTVINPDNAPKVVVIEFV